MDSDWKQLLKQEAAGLGVPLDDGAVEKLSAHVDLLLKWNPKVNLTRITRHEEVRIKHVLDSLGALPLVPEGATTALDMGSGAGFPGIVWMCARPGLKVVMVDSVAKKVSFLKTVLAQLKLPGLAVHARLEGKPEAEGVGRTQVVVSRAFTELGALLDLARPYLEPGGCVVAMLGPRETAEQARALAEARGFTVEAEQPFALPKGMGERRVLRCVPRGT